MIQLAQPVPAKATFSRAEAKRALRILDNALETEEGWQFARESGAVAAIYGAIVVLEDYLANSKAVPLGKRSREDIYAHQMTGRQATDSRTDSQVGASVR